MKPGKQWELMMGTKIDFDMTNLGGLSVHVEATMTPAEPDVGIFSSYIDDYELFVYGPERGGKPRKLKKAWKSLYARVNEKEMELLDEKAHEAFAESKNYDYDEPEYEREFQD